MNVANAIFFSVLFAGTHMYVYIFMVCWQITRTFH